MFVSANANIFFFNFSFFFFKRGRKIHELVLIDFATRCLFYLLLADGYKDKALCRSWLHVNFLHSEEIIWLTIDGNVQYISHVH